MQQEQEQVLQRLQVPQGAHRLQGPQQNQVLQPESRP